MSRAGSVHSIVRVYDDDKKLSCLRFGKQIGTARSSNADIGGN